MAVAFPACLGTAMLVDGICRFVLNPGGNVALLVVGMAVTLGAVALDVAVFRMHGLEKLLDLAREGKTKSTRKTVSLKPIALSVTAGLLLGSLNPVINLARAGENGLGPYSLGFVFAAGVLFSTLVFNLFFINLPVEGEPADMIVYFRAQMSLHGVGLLGGIIWYGGAVATLVAARAEGAAYVMPALSYAITSAAVLVGTLWGIAVWKELESTNPAVKTWLGLVLILLAAGIAAFSANISFAA